MNIYVFMALVGKKNKQKNKSQITLEIKSTSELQNQVRQMQHNWLAWGCSQLEHVNCGLRKF